MVNITSSSSWINWTEEESMVVCRRSEKMLREILGEKKSKTLAGEVSEIVSRRRITK